MIENALNDFIDIFELVFHADWEYSKGKIESGNAIAKDGTFLDPFPGEHYIGSSGSNWSNRSALLAAYREVKALAISEGIRRP